MRTVSIMAAGLVLVIVGVVGNRATSVQGQTRQDVRVAAVPSEKGGQHLYGAYEIVTNWPKPISSLPGHEKWTWGAGQSVFAESANRVFILQRGELPNLQRPKTIQLPQLGPNIEGPLGRLPCRDATSTSRPGQVETTDVKVAANPEAGKTGNDSNCTHYIALDAATGDATQHA